MRADNSTFVIAAARRRSQAKHRRTVAALRRMDTAGVAVTFDAVAREANVSRSWLYNKPDLRAEIERLRQRERPSGRRPVPDRQRASEASLQRRLELASERIRHWKPTTSVCDQFDDCGQRLAGDQWCPDCQRPCRRVDFGGLCPSCGDAITLTELIEAPMA